MGRVQAPASGRLRHQPILRIFLALAAIISSGAQFNATDLSTLISTLPEESCMSLKQLKEAVLQAAWVAPPPFNVSVVMLTTCNLRVSLPVDSRVIYFDVDHKCMPLRWLLAWMGYRAP